MLPASNLKKYLLPNIFQTAGLVLAIAGIVMTYLRFGAGIKPGFLDVKVFAFYSTYFDTRYFRIIDNNFGEEVCGITLLLGLFLVAFSREKNEKEHFWIFRLKAFILATYCSVAFLLLSFFFVYGLAFFNMLSLYIILPLLSYSLIFRYYMVKDRHSSSS